MIPSQQRYVAENRRESVLDKSVALGTLHCVKPFQGVEGA
jgi:hypothetical protein